MTVFFENVVKEEDGPWMHVNPIINVINHADQIQVIQSCYMNDQAEIKTD
jgi:hypothetical protein